MRRRSSGALAAADQFEQAVGNHAMGHEAAKGAASALAQKAIGVTDAYLKAMEDASASQAQMDTSFQAILGGAGPTWAGSAAVPIPADAPNKAELAAQNVARIRTVAASGNVREMVNLAVSFIYQSGETAINDIANEAVEMETFYTEAKAKVGALDAGVTDFTTTVDTNIKAYQAKAAEAEKRGEEAPKAWAGVVTDNATVSAGQGSSRTKSPLDQKSTISQRKVGSLGEYAQLSENEKLLMFGEAAAKEQSLKTEHLTWSEGRKVWFINEADAFVQKCRAASVPLGGGISGTTGRIMETARIFNTGSSPVDVRAAAIGYLLPIRAHTLIEVMKGAEPFGGGAVGEPSFAIYRDIQPFGDLRALHPNATFTQLVEQTHKKTGGAWAGTRLGRKSGWCREVYRLAIATGRWSPPRARFLTIPPTTRGRRVSATSVATAFIVGAAMDRWFRTPPGRAVSGATRAGAPRRRCSRAASSTASTRTDPMGMFPTGGPAPGTLPAPSR